jgi:hypothetical protein
VGVVIRYFAYGSNLMSERMRERGAEILSARPAVLRDHRLAFDKAGRDGSGRANVVRVLGGQVYGVLYEVTQAGLETLRIFESGYDLVDVLVECARPDGGVEVLAAKTFMARADRRTDAPPSRGYLATVLEGIREHRLPEPARDEVERALEPKKRDG